MLCANASDVYEQEHGGHGQAHTATSESASTFSPHRAAHTSTVPLITGR